jgi:hypothetical protein
MLEEFFGLFEGAGDNMNADEFPNAPGSSGSGFRRRLHGPDIATHQHRYISVEEVLFPDHDDIRGLCHCIGGLNSPDKATRFDHSQRFVHISWHTVYLKVGSKPGAYGNKTC